MRPLEVLVGPFHMGFRGALGDREPPTDFSIALTGNHLKPRSTGGLLQAGIPAREHYLCFETSSDSQR